MSAFLKITEKNALSAEFHEGTAAQEDLQGPDVERKGMMAKRLPLR